MPDEGKDRIRTALVKAMKNAPVTHGELDELLQVLQEQTLIQTWALCQTALELVSIFIAKPAPKMLQSLAAKYKEQAEESLRQMTPETRSKVEALLK